MNKLAKIIISILSCITVFLLIIVIVLLNKKDSCNNQDDEQKKESVNVEEINKVSGIYHTNNWNNKEATLELNKDMTCKYPTGRHTCKWTLSDNKVIITLINYELIDDKSNASYYYEIKSEEECKDLIEQNKDKYINPRCNAKESKHEAKIVNNGVVLYDKLLNKLN